MIEEKDKYVPFSRFAEMYGCSEDDVKNVWRKHVMNEENKRDDAVWYIDQNRLHAAMGKENYTAKWGYCIDDLGNITQTKLSVIKSENRIVTGITIDTATVDVLKNVNGTAADFVIESLEEYLQSYIFDLSEIKKYPLVGRKVFKVFNIPEKLVEKLEAACYGKRIKGKLVEIAIWRKYNETCKV